MAHPQPAWLYAHNPALRKLSSTLPSTFCSTLPIALDNTLPACLTISSEVSSQDSVKYTPSTFSSTLSGILSMTLPIPLNGIFPACLTIRSQTSAQEALKHTPKHAFQYTPNCTRWHTSRLLDHILPSKLSRRSQVHSEFVLKYTPRHTPKDAPNCTRLYTPSLLDLCCQLSSQDAPNYTPSALQSTPLSMFSSTLPSMLCRTVLISIDGIPLACVALRSRVLSQEARYSRSRFTVCFHVCSQVLDP